jgi:hypothetical protein
MMRGAKDAALAFTVRRLVNSRLEGIGSVTDLSLNTAERRIRLRLELRGEPAAIDLDVRDYRIEQGEGGDWLTIGDAVASREWLTAALQQYVVGQRFPIPAKAAGALRMLT